MKNFNWKKIGFISALILFGFGLMQIPFTQIIGSSLKFSLFDFYGPIIGGLIGSTTGVVTVGIMQLANWAWHGFQTDGASLIRLLPMLFSVLYFAGKTRWNLVIPVIAMITFWAHPEGRLAWIYPLYWLIPIVAYFFQDKYLLARALGATFTAHAVGGALWIWVFNMKASIWLSLMPIVWKERGLMMLGICFTYIAFNYLLSILSKKLHWQLLFVKLNPKYSTK